MMILTMPNAGGVRLFSDLRTFQIAALYMKSETLVGLRFCFDMPSHAERVDESQGYLAIWVWTSVSTGSPESVVTLSSFTKKMSGPWLPDFSNMPVSVSVSQDVTRANRSPICSRVPAAMVRFNGNSSETPRGSPSVWSCPIPTSGRKGRNCMGGLRHRRDMLASSAP